MTFEEASLLTSSEKISLVTCEAVSLVKIFSIHSGSIYYKNVDYFVSNVKQNGVFLEKSLTLAGMTAGTFYYDYLTKKIYVWCIGDGNPKLSEMALVYKLFFSNAPLIAPNDLSSGFDVEWLPIVQNIGSIGQQLDDQNVGIVLESQSKVDLINQGFFEPIFDSLIWENQEINFYYWFRGISFLEAKKIFTGVIDSKDYSSDKITFNVKDYVYKLKNKLNLNLFSDSDGDVIDSLIGTPKRRIYGQVKQLKTVGIDSIKDGYNLNGTVTINEGSNIVTGTGTSFLSQLSPGDNLIFTVAEEKIYFAIDAISSNTSATLAKNSTQKIINLPCIVKPEISYRMKNRRWHIAGHKIRKSQALIISVISSRQFEVDDVSEFYSNDIVQINGVSTRVTRISGNRIILNQAIFPAPSVGNVIYKEPVTAVYFNGQELILNRDFSLTNTTEAILEINPLAEFNIAKERLTSINLVFTNASNIVTLATGQTADLRALLKSRDWIRKQTMNTVSWYEILSVTESTITLRTNYSDTITGTDKGLFKNVNIISDDSIILTDCYGYDRSGKWLKTASDCVKHLIEDDAGFLNVNTASFDQASSDCNYIISMAIPENVGEESPIIREVITKINDSIFGSLYSNKDQEISYSVINTRRNFDIDEINDDDIINWDAQTSQKIVNKVKINFCPFVDKVSGEQGFNVVNYSNSFVNNYIGLNNTIEKTCYLFNQSDAEKISQRVAFFNSLSQSLIRINSKSNFFTSSVNDRVYLGLDRLYKRYGGESYKKVGIISGIKKSQYGCEIVVNDLGNIFNRCLTYAPTGTNSFTSATYDEKIKYGFILDPETLTPNVSSEEGLGSNILG